MSHYKKYTQACLYGGIFALILFVLGKIAGFYTAATGGLFISVIFLYIGSFSEEYSKSQAGRFALGGTPGRGKTGKPGKPGRHGSSLIRLIFFAVIGFFLVEQIIYYFSMDIFADKPGLFVLRSLFVLIVHLVGSYTVLFGFLTLGKIFIEETAHVLSIAVGSCLHFLINISMVRGNTVIAGLILLMAGYVVITRLLFPGKLSPKRLKCW